jgi:murein DD-endopeptidase MepM/ murein hydrolase activator NlpD
MMSRRRSLVGVVPRGTQRFLVFLCVAAMVAPSLANAKRGKRTSEAAQDGDDRSIDLGLDTQSLAESIDRKHAADGIVFTERPAARGDRVVDPAELPARDASPRVYGSADEVDEHVHVQHGDTLEHILVMKGLGSAEAYPWLRAAQGVYDLRLVKPKRGFTLHFDRATRELQSVRYEIDNSSLLTLERRFDGTVVGRREALPYFVEIKGVTGRIDRGLKPDSMEAGVPPDVASELVDIFGWDLDVGANLQPGDEFRIIYENMWETGKAAPSPGKILGAQIVTRGTTLTAVLFENEDGSGGYYTPDGQALSRDFLRYPLEFKEISSEFSMGRYHPILHRWRPHRGVDLAAPRGTPVRAVADGWVKEAHWMGGLGRAVQLEHMGDRVTTYGHLSEIAPGIQEGATVEQGQVIGYVGSTGLATGPHLHYEVEEGGVHLDPMQFEVEPEDPVDTQVRRRFDKVRTAVVRQLAGLPTADRPWSVSLSAASFRAE